MATVLLVSDSHGLTTDLEEIKYRHQADYMIHCGDSELDMDAVELEGFIKVGGNCDMDTRFPNEERVTINGLVFFLVHGHLHQVKTGLLPLSYRAKEENAHVVCFGHTHMAGSWKTGNLLFINPGSIHLPRNRTEKTYVLLHWETKDSIKVDFHTVQGDLLGDLSTIYTLRD